LLDDRQHLGRALRGVPAEVEQLPSISGSGEVALLVERLGVRPEVEPPAVTFQPELDIGQADVGARHDATVQTADRVLRDHCAEVAVGEAPCQQLLEPRVRDAALVRDRRQMARQQSGAALAGPVQEFGSRLHPAQARAAADVGQRPAPHRWVWAHRADVDQRACQSGAADAVDHDDVGRSERVDVMRHGAVAVPPSMGAGHADFDDARGLETIEPMESSRRAV